jgi:hypothetical protein
MSHLVQLQRALQAHVVDGELAIADAIDSSIEVSAATRLKIYSDAYRLRLIDALKANHPVLAQLVGETQFARLAQEYLAIHPSRHYSIRWFGHLLAEFLRDFPDYRNQPWLAELAAWEWKIATAFDATDAAILTAERLANVAPDEWPDLRFTLHPSVQRITLGSNIVAIVQAKDREEPLPAPANQARAEWLIWRQDLVVQYRPLDSIETAAIDAINNGATFSEMCEAIAEHSDDDDQVPLVAAGFLKQWIANQCVAETQVRLAGAV